LVKEGKEEEEGVKWGGASTQGSNWSFFGNKSRKEIEDGGPGGSSVLKDPGSTGVCAC